MSRAGNSAKPGKLGGAFSSAGSKSRAEKTHFVTVRLTAAEKQRLDREAAGESTSAYVRDRLFEGSKRAKASYSIADQKALAQVLRALAQSNLALDLDAICHASETGELPITDALSARLHVACEDVAAIRKDLIRALGLRPK